jgi:hypothetical protein
MSKTLGYFVQDYLFLIWERAQEAQAECRQSRASTSSEDTAFQCGRALVYYKVLSTFKNQAQSFEIEDRVYGLKDIDPDQLLDLVH